MNYNLQFLKLDTEFSKRGYGWGVVLRNKFWESYKTTLNQIDHTQNLRNHLY